jgi:hypothetical protein
VENENELRHNVQKICAEHFNGPLEEVRSKKHLHNKENMLHGAVEKLAVSWSRHFALP